MFLDYHGDMFGGGAVVLFGVKERLLRQSAIQRTRLEHDQDTTSSICRFVVVFSSSVQRNKTQHHRFVDLSLYSVVPYKGIRDIDNTNLFKRECIVLVRKRSMDNKQIEMDL